MSRLSTRLFLTLVYSGAFSFPLAASEWARRLYQLQEDRGELLTANSLSDEIIGLVKTNTVQQLGSFFVPSQANDPQITAMLREERRILSQQKRAEIAPLIHFCNLIPWIKGLAITGSVAVENAEKLSDVDCMVVCAKNRLWLVRPILILFSQLYGKRRTWRGEEQNSWCFNLWLEQQAMGVPLQNRSVYTAYEVCQARWVIDKDMTKDLFFLANRWASSYVPKLFLFSLFQSVATQHSRSIAIPIISNILDLANYISYLLQRAYMHGHMTRERVTPNFAAFHPRDTRAMIFDRMRRLIPGSQFSQTVLVTGVFDVLHKEHIEFLKKAKELGGELVVGIESDARVRSLKGEGRPVHTQGERRKTIEKLGIAQRVFVLPELFSSPEDHRRLLASIRPTILAVSSHSPHLDEKHRLMQEIGGRVVVVHEHNPAISSTILLKQKTKNGKS